MSELDLGKIILENTTPPHNKYYIMKFSKAEDFSYVIRYRYGRRVWQWQTREDHGIKGVKTFTYKRKAIIWIKNNLYNRSKRGYKVQGLPTLDLERF